jgi:mannose-1-phosphate guanylyltransferase
MPGQQLNYSARPVALIFAGGEGKRLWPISSADEPKQLNPLFAKDTLVVEAYKRAKKFIPEEDIYVVTTRLLSEKVVSRLHIPESQI